MVASLVPMDQSRVAVITGGTGSVGFCLVPMLIDRGFSVAVTYLLPDEATRLEEKMELFHKEQLNTKNGEWQ